MLILNSLSLNMIPVFPTSISIKEICLTEAREIAQFGESAVGHQDTAAIFSAVLGIPVVMNRVSVTLEKGMTALVGQYIGPRLMEGATTLPTGATIKWLLVSVE